MTNPIDRLNAALEGRYRIERELGEGGMAMVYLADDLKHERKVALKVLKPDLAAVVGGDRFLAEIKTTANLQHPHILPLFDSGQADGFLFYVMPYVEGETLRDRIDRERQLPVDEALGIATAVANALHAAHEQGVVHRDIKPGNILMSRGQPLVADFGIALAVTAGGSGRLTETGLSLGTPYYMSPEQATGDQAVGPASDTFALACVLYEMLIGEPPYPGNTAQAVLGKIIQGVPVSATIVRRSVPANVDAAIRKALEKLPADRFTGAQDFARALADPSFRHGETAFGASGVQAGRWRPWAIASTVLAVLFALTTGWALLGSGAPEPVRHVERFAMPFQDGQEPTYRGESGFALSPDGTMLVYRRQVDGQQVLLVRRWDDLSATPIRESDGGRRPAVSPDGSQVAFDVDGSIRVASLSGGPVRTLMRGEWPEWGPDDLVYATTDSGTVRSPSRGGTVESVSRLEEGDISHRVSDVIPGRGGALLDVQLANGSGEIRALDLENGKTTRIADGGLPRYLPSGHLVYRGGDGTMMAARFDPDRMELVGAAVPVMDGLAFWSLADDGKLFYVAGSSVAGESGPRLQLAWVSPEGQASVVESAPTFLRGPDDAVGLSFSPDGSTVALREFSDGGYDIWLQRLEDGRHQRLTFDEAHEKMPVFDPRGGAVTYLSNRNGDFDVWSKPADGSGQPELLLDLDASIHSFAWSRDAEWLVAWTAADDIVAYRPGEDLEPVPLLAEGYDEFDPAISPDGRWIAYASDETGNDQIYVRPFPDVASGRWQVSSEPARYPRWAQDGRTLYYQDTGASPAVWKVEYAADPVFEPGPPVKFFEAPSQWNGSAQFGEAYEIAPDDARFIILLQGDSTLEEGDPRVRVVLMNNFTEELKRRVPN
jgi:serine/threonine-protein kinase